MGREERVREASGELERREAVERGHDHDCEVGSNNPIGLLLMNKKREPIKPKTR